MLTVHHLNNSRSQRVLWLLEELGVPYEIKHYERDPKTMRGGDRKLLSRAPSRGTYCKTASAIKRGASPLAMLASC